MELPATVDKCLDLVPVIENIFFFRHSHSLVVIPTEASRLEIAAVDLTEKMPLFKTLLRDNQVICIHVKILFSFRYKGEKQ